MTKASEIRSSNESTISDKAGRATPTSDETPKFCKRISVEEVDADAKLTTHNELIKMGALMEATNAKNKPATVDVKEIFKIKTMSLAELYEYVEKKLSKDHYSPEVIYLLFKIQSLLLEKEHLIQELNNNNTTIIELKKEILDEKVLTGDLKDSIKETTGELDTMEKENTAEFARLTAEVSKINTANKIITVKKDQYEHALYYFVPFTFASIAIFINYIIGMISRVLSNF